MRKILLGMAFMLGMLAAVPVGSAAPLSDQDKAALGQSHTGLFYLYTATVDFNIAEQLKRAKAAIDEEQDYSMAVAVLDKVIELDAKNAEAYLLRAIAKSRLGEEKKSSNDFYAAQKDFRQALMLEPDNPTFWFYRGECGILYSQTIVDVISHDKDCQGSFEEALKICPNYLDAMVRLGDSYLIDYQIRISKDWLTDERTLEKAVDCYNKALVLVPNHGTIVAKKEMVKDMIKEIKTKKQEKEDEQRRQEELRRRVG